MLDKSSRYRVGSASAPESAPQGAVDPLSSATLSPDVLKRAAELAATIEEGTSSRLAQMHAEWNGLQQQLGEVQAAHDSAADAVSELSQELAFMNKELEARQRELAERSNVMSDASVLAALQAAIERLEQELRGMDVRIGLTSSLLLDAQTGAA